MSKDDAVLCFVDRSWPRAWFTTRPLNEQWGDDWDDAPYEHNAGHPYYWNPRVDKGTPYTLFYVFFDADLVTPCDGCLNSSWSVEQINKGAVAWLRSRSHVKDPTVILAGTPYGEFKKLIWSTGGQIFEELAAPVHSK